MDIARLSVAYRDRGVVAFDLAGGEAGRPCGAHRAAFDLALEGRLGITVHAGEAAGPESIAGAILHCHAQRIGHGTRLYQDTGLRDYLRDRRIPLEINISSNVHTHAVARTDDPVREYYDAGVAVTLCTDGWLMSGVSLTDEYWLAHTALGFTRQEIDRIILTAFEHAFLPWPERQALPPAHPGRAGGASVSARRAPLADLLFGVRDRGAAAVARVVGRGSVRWWRADGAADMRRRRDAAAPVDPRRRGAGAAQRAAHRRARARRDIGLGVALSRDRRSIRWRVVAWGLGLQVTFVIFVLRVPAGQAPFRGLGEFVTGSSTTPTRGRLRFRGAGSWIEARRGVRPADPSGHHLCSALFAIMYDLGIMQVVVRCSRRS